MINIKMQLCCSAQYFWETRQNFFHPEIYSKRKKHICIKIQVNCKEDSDDSFYQQREPEYHYCCKHHTDSLHANLWTS